MDQQRLDMLFISGLYHMCVVLSRPIDMFMWYFRIETKPKGIHDEPIFSPSNLTLLFQK
jgi:hypothetical protein